MVTPLTVNDIYQQAKMQLLRAGVQNAAFETLCLTQKHFGLDRGGIVRQGGERPAESVRQAFFEDVSLRQTGRPLQYILGEWEIYGHKFKVGDGVLIPRQETEILIETALKKIRDIKSPLIVDLCAGSGCVAICLAHIRPDATVLAVELSDTAFWYLKQNVAQDGLENVAVYQSDILCGPMGLLDRQADLIVSNPPYIKTGDLARLQREVRFEPGMALDGGGDGLKFYRAIATHWLPFLKRDGVVAVEIGQDQQHEVQRIFASAGVREMEHVADYAGIDRVVAGKM